MNEFEELEHVQVARVEPGDVVVARLKRGPVPVEAIKRVVDRLQKAFPGNEVMVLDDTADLEIMRQG